MKEPIFLKSVFQEKIWGGSRLKTVFNYDIPDKPIGECWAISAHPHGVCTVKNGKFKGQRLDDLWTNHQELFGNSSDPVFPLLTKILDAEDDLSVQVHPDDEYGLKNEGELGKTECWYVIQADDGAEIIYGHHAQTKEELEKLINTGEWDKLLRRVKVKAGDFFYVPSGTIHAIGKGIMILETQQSSDTTYRVYDYDRLDDAGKARELHIKQSIDVTTVPHHDPKLNITETSGALKVKNFVKTPFFNVYEWRVNGDGVVELKAAYTLASVIAGVGEMIVDGEVYPLAMGEHFILPNEIKKVELKGELQIIVSEPGSKL